MKRFIFAVFLFLFALSACGVNIAGRFYPEDTKALHFRIREFTAVPENLYRLSQLEQLSISYSEISRLTGLEGLSNLVELNLDHNKIYRIQGLEGLPALKTLNLSYNEIDKIENLETLTRLTILDLSHNPIMKLNNLEMLTGLSDLYIIAAPIQSISSNTFKRLLSNQTRIHAFEGSNTIDIREYMRVAGVRFIRITNTNAAVIRRSENISARSNQ